MKKHPEITAQTRETMTQAFLELYRTKKLEHITVKEIVAKAGYNRSTFYLYFKDTADVLEQLEENLLIQLKATMNSDGLSWSFQHLTANLIALYQSPQVDLLCLLLGENGDPLFARKLKDTIRPIFLNVLGLSDQDKHTSYLWEILFSLGITTLLNWYKNEQDLPADELISMGQSILMHGLLPVIMQYSTGIKITHLPVPYDGSLPPTK